MAKELKHPSLASLFPLHSPPIDTEGSTGKGLHSSHIPEATQGGGTCDFSTRIFRISLHYTHQCSNTLTRFSLRRNHSRGCLCIFK